MVVKMQQPLGLHGVSRGDPAAGEMPDDAVVLGGELLQEAESLVLVPLLSVDLAVDEEHRYPGGYNESSHV